MQITFIEILLSITVLVDIILATLVFLNRNKIKSSFYFSIAAYSATMWVGAMLAFYVLNDKNLLIIPTKLLYIAGILIAQNFLYFTCYFLNKNLSPLPRHIFLTTFILTIVSIFFIIFSGSIVSGIDYQASEKVVLFGTLYIPYAVLMFFYFLLAYKKLFRHLRIAQEEHNQIENQQLAYVIIGTGVSVMTGIVCNIILPYFGIFEYYWVGPFMNIIFVSATTYAILKHHLFNLKLIAAELLTFAIWVAVISRAVMAETVNGKILGGVIFVFTFLAGIFLIRSVKKEVAQREQIEELAGRVKSVNRIMSHDIKNVLGKNKDMFGMLLDGSFGALSEKPENSIDRVPSQQSFVNLRFLHRAWYDWGDNIYEISH